LPGMQQKVQLYVVHPAFSVKFATSDRALWERGCCDVGVCLCVCMVYRVVYRVVYGVVEAGGQRERERERERRWTRRLGQCVTDGLTIDYTGNVNAEEGAKGHTRDDGEGEDAAHMQHSNPPRTRQSTPRTGAYSR